LTATLKVEMILTARSMVRLTVMLMA